jgi:hypothetical protein
VIQRIIVITLGSVGVFVFAIYVNNNIVSAKGVWSYIIIGCWLILVVGFYLREDKLHKNVFKQRKTIPVDDIYMQFYQDSGISKEIFVHNWNLIESDLFIGTGKLRPDDKTDSFWFLQEPFGSLKTLIYKEAYKNKKHPKDIKTIDDVVRLLGKEKMDEEDFL